MIIEFFTEPYLVEFENGQPVHEEKWAERELYKLYAAGDRNSAFVGRVTDQIKKEYPHEYAAFKAGDIQTAKGYPLKMWAPMSAPMVKLLNIRGLTTVEQLAEVSDANLPGLGPSMSKYRDMAQKWLEEKKGSAPIEAVMKENASLKQEMAALRTIIENIAAPKAAPKQVSELEVVPDGKTMPEINADAVDAPANANDEEDDD